MSLKGLVAVHASQALAVAFGGVLAAAGRGQSSPLGMLVGGVCGGLFLAYELLAGAPPQDLVLYLQLPVLAMFGLIAGTAGGRFWGAAPKIEVPILSASALSSLRLLEEEKPAPGRPTAWLRVMAGAAVIVLGVTVADHLREGAQHFSGGLLRVRGPVQGEFVSWQLAAFAVLLGGMISGANTGAGTWHGFLSGVLGAIGVYALCANTGGPLPPVDFWLETLGLGGLPLFNAGVIGGVMGGIVLASLLGGWLGGALLVPLAPEHMRRRLRGGLD
jgi:hypothetical protein